MRASLARKTAQFDWSEDGAIISNERTGNECTGNERTKLQMPHTKLGFSRAFVVRAGVVGVLHGTGVIA